VFGIVCFGREGEGAELADFGGEFRRTAVPVDGVRSRDAVCFAAGVQRRRNVEWAGSSGGGWFSGDGVCERRRGYVADADERIGGADAGRVESGGRRGVLLWGIGECGVDGIDCGVEHDGDGGSGAGYEHVVKADGAVGGHENSGAGGLCGDLDGGGGPGAGSPGCGRGVEMSLDAARTSACATHAQKMSLRMAGAIWISISALGFESASMAVSMI